MNKLRRLFMLVFFSFELLGFHLSPRKEDVGIFKTENVK